MVRLNRRIKRFTYLELFIISVCAFLLLGGVLSLAQEQITITTYYPAPYGIYKELRADQMAIGSSYRNTNITNGTLLVWSNLVVGPTKPALLNATNVIALTDAVGPKLVIDSSGNVSTHGNYFMHVDATEPNGCMALTFGSNTGVITCPGTTHLYNYTVGNASDTGGILLCCQ